MQERLRHRAQPAPSVPSHSFPDAFVTLQAFIHSRIHKVLHSNSVWSGAAGSGGALPPNIREFPKCFCGNGLCGIGRNWIAWQWGRCRCAPGVLSQTNWVNGAPVWDDGNDVADLSPEVIEAAQESGAVANARFLDSRGLYVEHGGVWVAAVRVEVVG